MRKTSDYQFVTIPTLFITLASFCQRSLVVISTGLLLLIVSFNSAAKPNNINNVRLWHSPEKTRVVFDVAENIQHKVFSLKAPDRLVVDIENGGLSAQLPNLSDGNTHISSVRVGAPKAGVLRFVFELKKPLDAHSFVLTPNELYGYRLVLDLMEFESEKPSQGLPSQETPKQAVSDVAVTNSPPATVNEPPNNMPVSVEPKPQQPEITPRNVASPASKRRLIVAIDAGHGGEDPGALGYRGSREKKITLSIAKRLKKVIDADARMSATLIREGDYYIDLHKRRIMARDRGADIFVSIHADAFTKRSARGLSVFALSQSGATSAMARALAKKENASDLIGGVSLANKDEVLAKVLVDLSMTNTISESVNLGGRVLKELAKVGRLHSRRVEQAGFAVLKSPDTPSILIETGFITNPEEERKLRSSKYQKQLANAIYTALVGYVEQTPYYNQATYQSPNIARASTTRQSATGQRPSTHKVVRGDSLSSIALKYGTSVAQLKKLNKLRSNTAVLGKRLKLPSGVNTQAANQVPEFHVVRRGDSLSKISARYNVTISALKRLNGLSRNSVRIGQKVKLPFAAIGAAAQTKTPTKPRVHRVKRGDTLSEIADRYGVTMKSIMQTNKLRSRVVRLGQKLKIPG